MPTRIRTRLGVFLLFCGLGSAWAQAAPGKAGAGAGAEAERQAGDAGGGGKGGPVARIRGWTLRDELDRSDVQQGPEVSLDPGRPEIIVFFDATPGDAVEAEYRYRLDGYDADWTLTQGHVAHYRRLPPGRYRFEVQARDRVGDGVWATREAVLAIQQMPFFYQTWLAFVLVGVVLLAIAGQLLNQRDRLLKGQMGMVLEERNRIAGECHDTLMAGFAAISWQLEATAKLFRRAGENVERAAQSCELARSMVAHCQAEARRIIWDLRDADEITNDLSHALAAATSTYRQRASPQTTLDIEGTGIPIAPGAVHHLVCIGQEALTNAVRHAESSRIQVKLCYESDSLRLTVRDNGRGFHLPDDSARTGHFGIPVMEERARKLGGALHLTSSAPGGTEVAVTVSFQRIYQAGIRQEHVVPWFGV